MYSLATWTQALLALALLLAILAQADERDTCTTDTDCFEQCENEGGRNCADVLGPVRTVRI